jgi:flagellar hook assembly protein FlgD
VIEETKLRANAPNPFAESTTIPYQLAERGPVTIAIYDLLGRRVETLVDGTQKAGVHEVEWRPGPERDRTLASGVYFCRMTAGAYTATRKLILVR